MQNWTIYEVADGHFLMRPSETPKEETSSWQRDLGIIQASDILVAMEEKEKFLIEHGYK